MTRFRVLIDLGRCQGYANCVIVAPDVFDVDEQTGTAVLLQDNPDESHRDAVQAAVEQCPTEAISIDR